MHRPITERRRINYESHSKEKRKTKREVKKRKERESGPTYVNNESTFASTFEYLKIIYIYSPLKRIEQPDIQGQKSEIGNGRVIFSRVSTIDPRSPNDKTLEDSFVLRDPECVIAPLSAKRAFEGVKSDESVGLRGQGVE